MNYGDHQQSQQQQYMMQQQGQRMQNPRMMNMQSHVPHNMPMQQRYAMPVGPQGQQQMQLPPTQYVSSPQMQQRGGQSLNEMLSRLPPELQQMAQQKINAEPNPDLKKRIAFGYIQSSQMRIYPSQNQQVLVNMNANQRVPMQPGNLAPSNAVRGPAMQQGVYQTQSPPMQSSMGSGAPGQGPIQRQQGHGFMPGGMQQLQGYQVSQEQTSSAAVLPNYNSPQPVNIQQPSSVGPVMSQNTSLQQKGPSSVPSAPYAQGHQQGNLDISTPSQNIPREDEKVSASDKAMYDKKLEELKVYHEQIKRLKERQIIDGTKVKPVYERLLELIEGRRTVKIELINKLSDSVQGLIDQCAPMFHTTRLLKNMSIELTTMSPLPDPWADMRQYSIGASENFARDDDFSLKDSSALKRPASPIEDHAIKRIKRESSSVATPPQIKMEAVDEGYYLDFPSITTSPQYRKDEYCFEEFNEIKSVTTEEPFIVKCRNGTQLELPGLVTTHLKNTRHRIDPDSIPVSSDCTEVQVLVDNDVLLAPPLRIVIPLDYPERGAFISREPAKNLATSLLYSQFDKRLAITSESNTIPQILHAWNIASEYVFKANYASRSIARD